MAMKYAEIPWIHGKHGTHEIPWCCKLNATGTICSIDCLLACMFVSFLAYFEISFLMLHMLRSAMMFGICGMSDRRTIAHGLAMFLVSDSTKNTRQN